MPTDISYEELNNLKDSNGDPIHWDSDMEEEGYDPPPEVTEYIAERKRIRAAQRQAFINDTRKIVGIHNREKKARRDARLAADKKRKNELHKKFLIQKANESNDNSHSDDGSSQCSSQISSPVKKKPTVDSDDEPLIKKKTVKKKKSSCSKKQTSKKTKSTSKKNLPVQKNTMAGYVLKGKSKVPDLDSVSVSVSTCPKAEPTFKETPTHSNEYSTPYSMDQKSNQVPNTNSTVSTSTSSLTNPFGSSLSYAPTDRYMPTPNSNPQPYQPSTSAYASSNPTHSVSSVDMLSTNHQHSPLDLNRICRGCGNKFESCFEYKLRKVCIHSVLDYFDEVGCDMVCELGIQKRYYSTFLSHSKAAILAKTTFWDLDDYISLPECMKQGSFLEAVELMKFDDRYEYWMGFRVHNVENHCKRLANKTWQYSEGDRIVEDKTHFRGIDVPPYMKFFGKR